MHSTFFIVASLALLAACACAPAAEEVIQHIPKQEPTPSATGKENAESGASVKGTGASEIVRHRRDAGQEADLLPSVDDVDASPFGESSQLAGRGRIRIISLVSAGISPFHDLKEKYSSKIFGDKLVLNSPHNVLKHLDDTILKGTKNVTQNPQMEETLYQISKDLVSAILSKIEMQDKITRITREALEASGKNKGVTAIETRRILDYISRTLSGHILTVTKASTEPELHRLVYGLSQIAAEVSIVSALKDITYAIALSKKQSVDLSLRKKRSIVSIPEVNLPTTQPTLKNTTIYNVILNKTINPNKDRKTSVVVGSKKSSIPITQFSVISKNEKKSVHVLNSKQADTISVKGFLNKTALEIENNNEELNDTGAIVLQKTINGTHYEKVENQSQDTHELNAQELTDDWVDTKENVYKPAINPDVIAEMEIDRTEIEDDVANEKKVKQKLERLEVKAKKAILYAGDVAYLTASSVVALRRALTASIEVQMSVKYAKNGMSNHQDLMMNLAKTAAQQAGKEAKTAGSKALACERVIKLALKYTAQSQGAELNHVANRIVMDTLSLATLAKSMAFVSSDIAINSLYQATDIRPPA
ncbi:Uncharacterized protein OBRU01_09576 [Operophtera brumata]|uniref:Uncharacterized protein n=1 Tax=Operophtera brumata TaxID=104452 RepID=A0A0L7LG21_OPEBR|nr:Uncharacterized protein OBRU01_09576 [Operophtera brumata]